MTVASRAVWRLTAVPSCTILIIGKAAGADKKLWRHIESRSDDLLGSSPPGPNEKGVGRKLLYYLVATMNQVFPDYDFSDLPPEVFHELALPQVMAHVNTTLFNSGIIKGATSEFSARIWEQMDTAIGLEECEIYSFDGADLDTEDPFWERGCMYLPEIGVTI